MAETTVYLARHAEKMTSGDNPELTTVGHSRANNIAQQLLNVGITHIFSTDYKRTIQTATPLAEKLNLEIQSYNPMQLAVFAQQLKAIKGKILVIGHSNTTPELTELLSGQRIKKIDDNEYNDLFQVIINQKKIILNNYKTAASNSPNKTQPTR
jgi:phosphohistidine phosphatase SixA